MYLVANSEIEKWLNGSPFGQHKKLQTLMSSNIENSVINVLIIFVGSVVLLLHFSLSLSLSVSISLFQLVPNSNQFDPFIFTGIVYKKKTDAWTMSASAYSKL